MKKIFFIAILSLVSMFSVAAPTTDATTSGKKTTVTVKIAGVDEGIDFDKKSMTVWFTPTEEKYVDTSLENNPTIDKEIMTDVEVWSIFRRAKDGKKDDGNPLIYALKGERGWEFREESDREAIEKQFELIAEKFAKIHPVGVTILIPSGNNLNRHIAEVIMSKSKDLLIVTMTCISHTPI